jgi:hypothetical protein
MKRVYVCLAAAVLLLASSAVLAQSAPPSADTYSNSMKGDTGVNYGSSALLVVQPHGNNSYLQFNLSTVPAGATVNKATLRLFVDALVTSGSFDVYQLNTSWSESTLTFSNQPPLGVSATGSHPVAVSKANLNQFVVVDITSLVQGWQSGAIPNNGIALALTTATGSFSFDSKESVFTSTSRSWKSCSQASPGRKDHRVCKALREQPELLAPLAPSGPQATPAPRVRKEFRVQLATQAQPERKAWLAQSDRKARKEPKV